MLQAIRGKLLGISVNTRMPDQRRRSILAHARNALGDPRLCTALKVRTCLPVTYERPRNLPQDKSLQGVNAYATV